MAFAKELDAARRVAEQAAEIALRYQRAGIEAEDKPDQSPVTIADKECEEKIVSCLANAFPGDGFLGEEGASAQSSTGRRWIIDPIDGTRDFVRGNRLFAHLIGLEQDGEVVVGVAHFPALGEMYWATRNGGAWRNETRIGVSSIQSVNRAVACVNGLNKLAGPKLAEFLSRYWAVRSMGGAWDAMFVCAGHAEVWVEATAKPWDLAPLKVIAGEAGAVFTDMTGKPTIYGGNAVITTPALAAEAAWWQP